MVKEFTKLLQLLPPLTTALNVSMTVMYFAGKIIFSGGDIMAISGNFVTAAAQPPVADGFWSKTVTWTLKSVFWALYHRLGCHLAADVAWASATCVLLERRFGSFCLLQLTFCIVIFTQAVTWIAVNLPSVIFIKASQIWQNILGYNRQIPLEYGSIHSMGFSGSLFALHFLLLRVGYKHGRFHMRPAKYDELTILTSLAILHPLVVPDSHVLNNLAGLLSGSLFIALHDWSLAQDAIKYHVDSSHKEEDASLEYCNHQWQEIYNDYLVLNDKDNEMQNHYLKGLCGHEVYSCPCGCSQHQYLQELCPSSPWNQDRNLLAQELLLEKWNQDGSPIGEQELCLEPSYWSRGRDGLELDFNHRNHEANLLDGNYQTREDEEFVPELQWKCTICSWVNGVFLTFCEACTHERVV